MGLDTRPIRCGAGMFLKYEMRYNGGWGGGGGGVMTHVKKGHNNEDYRGELLNYIEVNKGK